MKTSWSALYFCTAIMACVSCGSDDSSALQEACKKSCERTVACVPQLGSAAQCQTQCAQAERTAADGCLTVQKTEACLAETTCEAYLSCAVELSECDEGDGAGGTGQGGSGGGGGKAGAAGTNGAGGTAGGGKGGTGGAQTGDASDVPLESFPPAFVSALCTRIFTCCKASESLIFGATPQECVSRLGPGLTEEFEVMQDLVEAGESLYASDKAAACIKALRDPSCDTATSNWEGICAPVFAGTKAVGGTCEDPLECTTGVCGGVLGARTMTCQATPGAGEACQVSCTQGFICHPVSQKCVAAGRVGARCQFDSECASASCSDGRCEASSDFCESLGAQVATSAQQRATSLPSAAYLTAAQLRTKL